MPFDEEVFNTLLPCLLSNTDSNKPIVISEILLSLIKDQTTFSLEKISNINEFISALLHTNLHLRLLNTFLANLYKIFNFIYHLEPTLAKQKEKFLTAIKQYLNHILKDSELIFDEMNYMLDYEQFNLALILACISSKNMQYDLVSIIQNSADSLCSRQILCQEILQKCKEKFPSTSEQENAFFELLTAIEEFYNCDLYDEKRDHLLLILLELQRNAEFTLEEINTLMELLLTDRNNNIKNLPINSEQFLMRNFFCVYFSQ